MSFPRIPRRLFQLVYLFSFLIFPLFVMCLASQRLANIPLRLGFFIVLVLGSAWLSRLAWTKLSWSSALALTSLGYGVVYKLASFIPDVSTYPFSLSWSEASRYYYASLWFSRQVYGIAVPPSVLHPSRYLLQSLPFLIPHAPLLALRLWQVILWIGTSALTSWLLVRRLTRGGENKKILFSLCMLLWAFLFVFQGPIYYHLLVMVIVLLWGFDSRRFWRSLILVILTSVWAGISRVNWLPVPGLLAGALYLMETPAWGKALWRYLLPPAIWVLAGTGAAYATQQAYQLASGNPVAWFGSSFSSDLLWYRLLPNQTYPLGILPSALLVSLPLVGLMVLRLWNNLREYHFIRILGLAAILGVLFAGGVVVSVKIGGGSNLHNLDAYLALLLVVGSYSYTDQFTTDRPAKSLEPGSDYPMTAPKPISRAVEAVLMVGALAIPLYFSLSVGGALPTYDFSAAQAAQQAIDTAVQGVANLGGEVLFINQRHLLTFGLIKEVPLVADDELVFLMEMAMSNNSTYLTAFHADLTRQRFALIVSEPLTTQLQGRTHGFGEENDAWVERVSEPILCYYEPEAVLDAVGVVLYIPRPEPCK